MRLLIIIGSVVAVLAAIWAGGWFALATWAEGQVASVLARVEDRGIKVECGERNMVGFPFAMRVACGETAVAERQTGTAAAFAGLTGGASVFSPRTAQFALASPAQIESPFLTGPADLRWDDADVHVAMNLNGPEAVSFDTNDLTAELPIPDLPATVAARNLAGTLAPAADGGTDADLSFVGLAVSNAGTAMPLVDGRLSAWISAPPRALLAGRAGLQAPLSARLMNLSLVSGEARLAADGDLSVDGDGIVDGTVTLRIAGAEALPGIIAALPVEQQKLANGAIGALLTFGSPTTLDGKRGSELKIEIERGEASIGPVSVRVPRVPL